MLVMPKKPPKQDVDSDKPAPKRKHFHIFITLDESTERRLQAFLDTHRVKPDRAAVALTALWEFLDRVEKTGPSVR